MSQERVNPSDDELKPDAVIGSEQLRTMARAAIHNHPAIASLLYDIDLLPEQIKKGDARREGYMADVIHAMLEFKGAAPHTYKDAALKEAMALLAEWKVTELDSMDEEFQPWLDSFGERIDTLERYIAHMKAAAQPNDGPSTTGCDDQLHDEPKSAAPQEPSKQQVGVRSEVEAWRTDNAKPAAAAPSDSRLSGLREAFTITAEHIDWCRQSGSLEKMRTAATISDLIHERIRQIEAQKDQGGGTPSVLNGQVESPSVSNLPPLQQVARPETAGGREKALEQAIKLVLDDWANANVIGKDAREQAEKALDQPTAACADGPSEMEVELALAWAKMPDAATDRINLIGTKILSNAVLRWHEQTRGKA